MQLERDQTCNSSKFGLDFFIDDILQGRNPSQVLLPEANTQVWKVVRTDRCIQGRDEVHGAQEVAASGSPCCRFIGRFRRTKSRSCAANQLGQVWNQTFATSRNCLWGFPSHVSSKNDSSRVLNAQHNFSNTNLCKYSVHPSMSRIAMNSSLACSKNLLPPKSKENR